MSRESGAPPRGFDTGERSAYTQALIQGFENMPLLPHSERTSRRLPRASSRSLRALGTGLVAGLLAVAAAPIAGADVPVDPHGVGGRVISAASPLPSATVYAYQSAGSHRKVTTDGGGGFLFDALPAGIYTIVAHKPGFMPVLLRLTRATAETYQFLELELAEAEASAASGRRDFWSAQAEIPPDVLRDMVVADLEAEARSAGWIAAPRAAFQTALQVESGVDEIASSGGGDARVTGGTARIEGQVGQVRLGLIGKHLQVVPARALEAGGGGPFDGQGSALSLEASREDTRVNLSSQSNHMTNDGVAAGSFDFEQHRLSLSHALSTRSRSQLFAQYTAESNFHRLGLVEPAAIPEASRSWRVEGTYLHELSRRSNFEAGVRYRLDTVTENGLTEGADLLGAPADERVDLFGRGGLSLRPALLVQYGLYTTLRDGTVSLSPQGGVVLQLSPTWQASMIASHRFDDGEPGRAGFLPAYFAETGECDRNEAQCYQAVLTHQKNEEEALSLGVTHREYGEVERVYFDEGFFNRFESLYLVPGDQVPELQFGASRRLSPTVVTRLESSLASGGGGIFRAGDTSPYENEVSYLVTSLDTRFQTTSTGLYLAFHQLRQALEALDAEAQPVADVEVERLQVRVTQDLGFLRELAADWALSLDMELSRGASPYEAAAAQDDEVRKRLLGGIAVSF